jgi:hypothetical protein
MTDILIIIVKRARRVRPKIEGMNQGAYTEEEEAKFLEGLNKFGRGWNQVVCSSMLI